ncbi:hypothetical protein MMC18_008061 [Xylographa bjoerkii]|nr:hypothetical protein [Xylographa bjoerkii]
MDIGRVVALDEAHKFMKDTQAASKLTESLKSVVRLQRHLGCRVIIATQEPKVAPELLNLSSVTLVHRFTSPEWLKALKAHLAAVSAEAATSGESGIFAQIVRLSVGEALLFAPSAILEAQEIVDVEGRSTWRPRKLGFRYVNVRIRGRLKSDGGKSVCAV